MLECILSADFLKFFKASNFIIKHDIFKLKIYVSYRTEISYNFTKCHFPTNMIITMIMDAI